MANYLFLGDTNPSGKIGDECCRFVMDLSEGLPIDSSFVLNGRAFNPRGGAGTGHTMYELFFDE